MAYCGFHAVDSGPRPSLSDSLSVEVGFWIPMPVLAVFRMPRAVMLIPNPRSSIKGFLG